MSHGLEPLCLHPGPPAGFGPCCSQRVGAASMRTARRPCGRRGLETCSGAWFPVRSHPAPGRDRMASGPRCLCRTDLTLPRDPCTVTSEPWGRPGLCSREGSGPHQLGGSSGALGHSNAWPGRGLGVTCCQLDLRGARGCGQLCEHRTRLRGGPMKNLDTEAWAHPWLAAHELGAPQPLSSNFPRVCPRCAPLGPAGSSGFPGGGSLPRILVGLCRVYPEVLRAPPSA